MKAIVQEKYGPPEQVLQLKEVPKPVPKENEVLVRIHTTAINDYDWGMARGLPYAYRLLFGLSKPKFPIMGMELAGVVEAVGPGVLGLKVGDAIFGDTSDFGFGSFAEYICINEKAMLKKPDNLSFEEATAIPHALGLAWQALKDMGKIGQGQKILINGGGGGVGTLGVQIAKQYNCEVTGVDSDEKLEMMRSLGFDQVLDYQKVNFTKTGEQYDLILDCKTNQSPSAYRRALKPGGQYVTIGGNLLGILNIALFGKLLSSFTNKKLQVLALKPNKGLEEAMAIFQQNKLSCIIDGPYSLKEVPRLVQYFGEGKHQGKIVIKMDQ